MTSFSISLNSLEQYRDGLTIAANPVAGALQKESVQDTTSGLSLVHFDDEEDEISLGIAHTVGRFILAPCTN